MNPDPFRTPYHLTAALLDAGMTAPEAEACGRESFYGSPSSPRAKLLRTHQETQIRAIALQRVLFPDGDDHR